MLYFVATPIGNLKDISYRAVETLQAVDVIACEDTRHSLSLLNAYSIKKPLMSFHKFNETEAGEKIVKMLLDGQNVAVITDAGTPGISDPGSVLCKLLIKNGLDFTVIPGANAFVPALIMSGFSTSRFAFIGFLPEKKKEREALFDKYSLIDASLIFYSAPHDIDDVVKVLFEYLGDRRAVAVREITKLFEERVPFNLKDGYNGEKRGEFVIVVEGANSDNQAQTDPIEQIKMYISLGMSKMDAIKQTAKEQNVAKNVLYKQFIDSEEK